MKYLVSLTLLFLSLLGRAQVQIGDVNFDESLPTRIDPDAFTRLRSTTTLFVLQDQDYSRLGDFNKAIRAAWKLTPYRIIRRQEMAQYILQPGYSFFSLERKGSSNEYQNSASLVYALWMPATPGSFLTM